jgi:predicted pyridoxine 5'-phosphate oxidase superfamily flavin-nucleotide-binding protein
MREIRTVERLESVVGVPKPMVSMKAIAELDDGCRAILAASPAAWLGYRDADGVPHTTLLGGEPGFATGDSPGWITLDMPAAHGGVSFVFMLPGVGETLRLNGRAGDGGVHVEEAFVHCARCMLRSKLWKPAPADQPDDVLAASPFVAVSTWDGAGNGDTSPRGDNPGFVRRLDDETLAVPDRRGNQRTDTFHNLMTCDQVSLAFAVPGRLDLLHVDGTGTVTDEPELLARMALAGKPPHAALLVRIRHLEHRPNAALAALWDQSRQVDRSTVPDLMHLAARHGAQNLASGHESGAAKAVLRTLGKGVGAIPAGLLRKGLDRGYRKALEDEGY